jgi:ketosteroid isomerase-like protein
MPTPDPVATARAFVEGINRHDASGLAALMTEDHRFVDATDQVFSGRDAMRKGWESYFGWFPDYRIEIVDSFAAGDDRVAFVGYASASFQGRQPAWRVPAAWRAVIRDRLVAEWRVYCDVEPMLHSMGAGRFPKS